MVTNNSLNNSSSPFDVDNLLLDDNTISSTNSNGNVIIDPNGTGDFLIASGDLDIQGGALSIDPGGATDSYIQFNESTTGKWRTGNDATDDSYRISQGSALGTNDTFIMTTGGQNTLPLQPAFRAKVSTPVTNVTGDGTAYQVVFNSEAFDTASNYDTSTGVFTAPIDGIYYFSGYAIFYQLTASHTNGWISFVSTSSTEQSMTMNVGYARTVDNWAYVIGTSVFNLSATDTVYMEATVDNGTKVVDVGGTFYGALLY